MVLIGMNAEELKSVTPCERFCKYFDMAKEVYCQSHDCDKVTQKMMVAWYNERFKATLTDVNLSKYLNGINDIPIVVYVNMKDLAGIEEMWLGASATREEYELSMNVKESLDFIRDEIEFMCSNPELRETCGESIPAILHKFLEYCEVATSNDYLSSKRKLRELQNEIYNAENAIAARKYECMYTSGHIKKSSLMKSENGFVKTTMNDVAIEGYDAAISKIHEIAKEIGKCIFLYCKIDEKHYWDIPKAEEVQIASILKKLL